jgi:plasmid stability protein
MASLTIRGLDQETKTRLRVRAARHGRSMEAEARHILADALVTQEDAPSTGLGRRIHARFAALGGLDVDLPTRSEQPRSADLS